MKKRKSIKYTATIIWSTSSSLTRFKSDLVNAGVNPVIAIQNRKDLEQYRNVLHSSEILFILAELDWQDEGDYAGLKLAKQLLEDFGETKPLNICFASFASRKFLLQNCSDEVSMVVKEFQLIHLPDIREEYDFLKYYSDRYSFILKNVFNPKFVSGIIMHAINKAAPDQSAEELKSCLSKISVYAYTFRGTEFGNILNVAKETDDCERLWEAVEGIRDIVIKQSAVNGLLPGLTLKDKFNVAVIDDTAGDRELLKKTIQDYFYIPEGFEFGKGDDALKKLEKEANSNDIRAVFIDLELLDEDGGNQPIQGINLVKALRNEYGSELQIRLVTSLSSEAIQSLGLGKEKVLHKRRGQYAMSEEGLHAFFKELNDDISKSLSQGLEGPDTGLFQNKTGLKRLYYTRKAEVSSMINRINDKLLNPANHLNSVSTSISKGQTVISMPESEKLVLLELLLTHRALLLKYMAEQNNAKGYSRNVIGWRFLYIEFIKPVHNLLLQKIKRHFTVASDLKELESLVISEIGDQPEICNKIKSFFNEYGRKPELVMKEISGDLETKLENMAKATKGNAYCNHILFDKALTAAAGELFSCYRPANNYYNTKLGFSGLSEEEDIQPDNGNNRQNNVIRFGNYIKCENIHHLRLFPHEKDYIRDLME